VVVAVVVVVAGCGLIGSGPTQEEYDALATQLETAQLEADSAFTEVMSLKSQLTESQASAQAQDLQAASGNISLERARLEVIRYARDNKDVYVPEYQNALLVWEVETAEEQQEFYYIHLTYRPFGDFGGTPGREEFIVDKTGNIEFRQVLEVPDPDALPQVTPQPASPLVRLPSTGR
jgi:hypothetical protein